jgi:hypothetical protein
MIIRLIVDSIPHDLIFLFCLVSISSETVIARFRIAAHDTFVLLVH